MVTSSLQKYFLNLSTFEKIEFYRLLQFLSFLRSYPTLEGIEEELNGQTYVTVQFLLIDFMKVIDQKMNTYQRQQSLQFFQLLQGLPPYTEKFADKQFRQLLFFPVVNAIQETNRGPWIIRISIASQLLYGQAYFYHFPPTFWKHSNQANLDVKLSILQAIAQESSVKKTYYIRTFLNQFLRSRHTTQAQVKREIIHEFNNLVKFQIIQPKFVFQRKDNLHIFDKDFIELQDLQSAELMYFYEIRNPI